MRTKKSLTDFSVAWMKAQVHPAAAAATRRRRRKGKRKRIRIDKTDLILGIAWADRPEKLLAYNRSFARKTPTGKGSSKTNK